MNVKTRMAPSPTGNLHLGTAYATLWPYLFARKNNGQFILRIEDTDKERSTKEYAENILEGLTWLGFEWDRGPFYQTDRMDIYKKYSDELLSSGKAYLCFCSKEELEARRKFQQVEGLPQVYSGKCRKLSVEELKEKKSKGINYVVRFAMPEGRGSIEFEDLIHGKISIEAKLIGDTVIMRQNNVPLYNFAVVIDDIDMGITHVLRGDDHISNTPKQIVLFEAFGKEVPRFGHFPVILNQDRSGKLSKRTGSTAIADYKKDGYLPEALINYLALLGWTPSDGKEILSKDELIKKFDVKDMTKAAAAWNQEKLDWINGEYIRMLSDEELTKRLQEYLVDHPAKDSIAPVVPLIKERIKKLSDFIPLTNFLFEDQEYEMKVFNKIKTSQKKEILEKILEKMVKMGGSWEAEEFESNFRDLADYFDISAGDMFQLIRIAISGQLVTPPLFESIKILGEDGTKNRVKEAIEFLSKV